MEDTKLLRIYLNDHLAGSVAGLELAKRTRSSNETTPLGDYLVEFMEQVIKEQEVIEDLLDALGAGPDRMKQLAAWIAEKAGRFKLNGQITGYSDLSRLVELEGLCLGVEGKLSLWRSLKRVRPSHPALSTIDLEALIERAEQQRATLESFRLEAARAALAGTEGQPGPAG